jgi:hypothetical protein
MPRISATPARRPMAANRPRILNLNGCGDWPRIVATTFFANVAACRIACCVVGVKPPGRDQYLRDRNGQNVTSPFLVNRWDLVYQNTSGLRTMKVRFTFNRYLAGRKGFRVHQS